MQAFSSIPAELSREVKEKLRQTINEKGVFKDLKKKVRKGMKIASADLEKNKISKKLERKFSEKDNSEIEALSRIYKYLEKRNLTWTLTTLIDEVAVPYENGTIKFNDSPKQRDDSSKSTVTAEESSKEAVSRDSEQQVQTDTVSKDEGIIEKKKEDDFFSSESVDNGEILGNKTENGVVIISKSEFERNELILHVNDL